MCLKTTHIIDPEGNPHQVTKEAFCWQTKLVVHLLWVDEAAPPVRTGAWRSPTMPEAIVAFYQSSSPNRGHLSAYKSFVEKLPSGFAQYRKIQPRRFQCSPRLINQPLSEESLGGKNSDGSNEDKYT